jgi:excisionase family DNA binding protein
MRTIMDEEYVTIVEAARLLHVHPSSVRRWIESGELPAHRVGQRRLLIKRAALAQLITPARAEREQGAQGSQIQRTTVPKLTTEQQQEWLAAIEQAKQRQAEMLAQRGGQPWSPSWELLNEVRDERSRQLS